MKAKNFRIKDTDWEKFKKVCSEHDTNASEALREFVQQANQYNSLDYEFKQTSIYDFLD